jgi:hypothetical protein
MMNRKCILFLSAAAAMQAMPLLAASPAPADPGAPVPPVQYQSALADYRAYTDENVADWRSVNDAVARAGGHVGIMRDATGHGMRSDKKAAAQPSGEPTPAQSQAPMRSAPQAPGSSAHSR